MNCGWCVLAYAAIARTVSGSMHGRHQLCKESQHNEEEQIQGQVPLWVYLSFSIVYMGKTKVVLLCYSTDSTGHIHLSGKASHHASKTAVNYYNASFMDVSSCNSCYHIHWLSYTFTHFSRGRNSVNQVDGVICLLHYVTLSGQCSRHTGSGVCLVWRTYYRVQYTMCCHMTTGHHVIL